MNKKRTTRLPNRLLLCAVLLYLSLYMNTYAMQPTKSGKEFSAVALQPSDSAFASETGNMEDILIKKYEKFIEENSTFTVVLVNGMRYEASLASSAVAPKDICRIPFGTADNAVGGTAQDSEHRTEGVPAALRPMPDGSFWVLDSVNQKMKRFNAKGVLLEVFDFPGKAPGKFVNISDFVIIPSGGFYVYDADLGSVKRLDATGHFILSIEGLEHSLEIGLDDEENLLVSNQLQQTLFRFDQYGELIERYDRQTYLTPIVDNRGRPFGVKFTDSSAELVRADKSSPLIVTSLASFPLDLPPNRNAHYVSASLLGRDEAGYIYMELVACDDDGVIHIDRIFRISNEGKIHSQLDILVVPFLSPNLVRHLTPTPDGNLLGFRSDGQSWIPILYEFPK